MSEKEELQRQHILHAADVVQSQLARRSEAQQRVIQDLSLGLVGYLLHFKDTSSKRKKPSRDVAKILADENRLDTDTFMEIAGKLRSREDLEKSIQSLTLDPELSRLLSIFVNDKDEFLVLSVEMAAKIALSRDSTLKESTLKSDGIRSLVYQLRLQRSAPLIFDQDTRPYGKKGFTVQVYYLTYRENYSW